MCLDICRHDDDKICASCIHIRAWFLMGQLKLQGHSDAPWKLRCFSTFIMITCIWSYNTGVKYLQIKITIYLLNKNVGYTCIVTSNKKVTGNRTLCDKHCEYKWSISPSYTIQANTYAHTIRDLGVLLWNGIGVALTNIFQDYFQAQKQSCEWRCTSETILKCWSINHMNPSSTITNIKVHGANMGPI